MTEQELSELIQRAVGDVDLSDGDIPAIDLYLDQILGLIAERNAVSAPRYRDRALTKTMINNYSKNGLISPILGKKYSRTHIVEILLVYAMKNTLSIEEIKWVLTGVRERGKFDTEEMMDIYRQFLSFKEKGRQRATDVVNGILERDGLSLDEEKGFFLTLLEILSLSAYLKEVGRELLEDRYADIIERERELELRAEQDKRVRKAHKKAKKKRAKADRVAMSAAKAEALIKELEGTDEHE